MKMIRAGMWLILGAVVVLGLSVAPSQAAVIFEDNFNGENGGSADLNYDNFSNWKVSNGTVDLIGNGSWDYYPGNGLYVDLDGSTGDAGKMTSRNFTLAPGNYEMNFTLRGSKVGSVTDSLYVSVEVGLVMQHLIILGPTDPFSYYIAPFTVSTAQDAYIVFDHLGGDNIGIILDDVRLTSVSNGSAVPEPSTLLLLGSGLLGLVGYGKRRMKK